MRLSREANFRGVGSVSFSLPFYIYFKQLGHVMRGARCLVFRRLFERSAVYSVYLFWYEYGKGSGCLVPLRCLQVLGLTAVCF